jgi:hypothetical protein
LETAREKAQQLRSSITKGFDPDEITENHRSVPNVQGVR